jgi:DNA modification methylase
VKCGAWKGQLGLEFDWSMYVEHLVELFREVKRVLKKTGSLWLNIGDTYSDKCLLGIPWRVAFALVDDGWILRNAVIWYKPSHMPESTKDRLTRTYEYVFHFVKSKKYYYNLDLIREPYKAGDSIEEILRYWGADKHGEYHGKAVKDYESARAQNAAEVKRKIIERFKDNPGIGKNPGDLWSINPKPFKGDHYAVFPPELPLRPILASCPTDGVVLDPLAGSGTVAYVCELINYGKWDEFRIYVNEIAKRTKWNLKWIMIEINPEYCKIMEKRLEQFMKQKSLDCFQVEDPV